MLLALRAQPKGVGKYLPTTDSPFSSYSSDKSFFFFFLFEGMAPPLPHLFLYFSHVPISSSPSVSSTCWEITVIPDLNILGKSPAS